MGRALRVISKIVLWLALSVVLAAIVFCALHPVGFLHAVGVMPRTPSTAYNFWSGFGSDIGEYSIATSLATGIFHSYRKHNCREDGCWRIGVHEYLDAHGQSHPACKHHHPHMGAGHIFHFHLLHAEKLAKQAQDG